MKAVKPKAEVEKEARKQAEEYMKLHYKPKTEEFRKTAK